ncbi:hypothetical protein LCGC14_2729730, partial [marine sediment metagenome]
CISIIVSIEALKEFLNDKKEKKSKDTLAKAAR